MDTTRELYKAKMEAQLHTWSARLAALKAKADDAGADAKSEWLKRAEQLTAFEASAKKHISEVEAAAADAWQKLGGEVEHTWNKLSGSIEALFASDSTEAPTKH